MRIRLVGPVSVLAVSSLALGTGFPGAIAVDLAADPILVAQQQSGGSTGSTTQGSGQSDAAAQDAPAEEGTMPPDAPGLSVSPEGFAGAVVVDADGNQVGDVVEVLSGDAGPESGRLVIELAESGKRVAVDLDQVEVGDNTIQLGEQLTAADLEGMQPYEGPVGDAGAESTGGSGGQSGQQ